jgi:glycine/D-amino acid oxidase-like deaminating enzyme
MKDRSVTVIGGGIVGLATAYHLSRLGSAVTLIDRSPEGQGASWGNAGSISPGSVLPVAYKGMLRDIPRMLFDPTGPLRVTTSGLREHGAWLARFLRQASARRIRASAGAVADLVSASLDRHADLLEAIGSQDLLKTTGQLHLYPDEAALHGDDFGWNLRREFGVRVEELDRKGLLALEPSIGQPYQAAVYLPEQGMILDPGDYAGRLRSVLRQANVRIVQDDIQALDIVDGQVAGLLGGDVRHECEEVVLCAGSWSTQLLRRHGYRIPLANQRGFHVQFDHPGIEINRVVVLADKKVFVTPMTKGLRAAGTVEVTGLRSQVDMRRADALVEHVRVAWPSLADEPRTRWSGERPCLPDSMPVMGRSGIHPNLWFNFGHGHLGLTLSAVAGEQIARSMAAGKATAMIVPFSPDRFAA